MPGAVLHNVVEYCTSPTGTSSNWSSCEIGLQTRHKHRRLLGQYIRRGYIWPLRLDLTPRSSS